jgi:hypothetical protein
MTVDWSRQFEDPVPLPRGRQLITLKNAADYIMKLSKGDRDLPEWQAAGEALIMAAEGRGPLLHARVGMLRALNRNVERVFDTSRKEKHWGAQAETRRVMADIYDGGEWILKTSRPRSNTAEFDRGGGFFSLPCRQRRRRRAQMRRAWP